MDESNLVVKMQFGSHVYGTNLPTSDLDLKAVYLPRAKDILLQRVRGAIVEKTKLDDAAKNTSEDTDFEAFSLQRYMELLLEGQTVALDMLFTPEEWWLQSSGLWLEIQRHRQQWLSSGITSFVGYARTQAAKYGIKGSRVAATREAIQLLDDLLSKSDPMDKLQAHWPSIEAFAAGREHVQIIEGVHSDNRPVKMLEVCNRKVQEHVTLKEARKVFQLIFDNYGKRALQAEQNEGVDWKAMCHAVRVCEQAHELLTSHAITFPRPEAPLLLKIRKGELPYPEVAAMLEAGMDRLEGSMRDSTLPKAPNHELAEALVVTAYSGRVMSFACGTADQKEANGIRS